MSSLGLSLADGVPGVSGANLTWVIVVAVVALLALVVAGVLVRQVLAASTGTEKMQEIAQIACEQLSEQQRRAAATCGVLRRLNAALQQSISPIAPPMLHDCSLECRGAPATALPATTSKITKDMSRVLIAIAHCMEND